MKVARGDRQRRIPIKSFCKPSKVDVTNWKQIYIAVYDCVKPKLYRNDFVDLLEKHCNITRYEIIQERSIPNGDTPKINAAIEELAKQCAEEIENQTLKFKLLRKFKRIDGLSGKERDLNQESPW